MSRRHAASSYPLLLWLAVCAVLLVAAAGDTCSDLPAEDLGQFDRRGCCQHSEGRFPSIGGPGLPVPRLATVLKQLGSARVVLVGDSMMEQTFDALRVQGALHLEKLVASHSCVVVPNATADPTTTDCGACPCGMRRVNCSAGVGCKSVYARPGGGLTVRSEG